MFDIQSICAELRRGASVLARQNTKQKNHALSRAACELRKQSAGIIEANRRDVERARTAGMSEPLIDRLSLNEARLASIIDSVNTVIDAPDPVGEIVSGRVLPNGLEVKEIRVPLGLAAIIYESRPEVTVDAFALAYKSGNAILLRGSAAALESNKALAAAIRAGLEQAGKDGVESAFALASGGERTEVDAILGARGLIDVVLPRGGAALIKFVAENARIPVIETGSGVCHLFVDESADIEQAARIAENGKLQRPGVCNALETLLVHRKRLGDFLPRLAEVFAGRAEFRADEEAYRVLSGTGAAAPRTIPASETDFGFEFLDTILAVKTVSGVDEAVSFINAHNTKHSEAIVTRSLENARVFQSGVDAACVYVNASTRFTDGGEFGLGAELGISTQKLHVRGPMGLRALTTTKYLINGEGQTR
ncbi:MAG: glutamate-5-semialdehyde dehydrogenase [Spirochaetaceae bacterium]|jgi:glutamate-5-semialdehyde dehydrogenase|nr:glutamate-5-semialdehyde dehydrogenase [Spirochaetaceae bacterium]